MNLIVNTTLIEYVTISLKLVKVNQQVLLGYVQMKDKMVGVHIIIIFQKTMNCSLNNKNVMKI